VRLVALFSPEHGILLDADSRVADEVDPGTGLAIHPLFGVIRFLQLVRGRPKAESPTQEMLRDVPFVLNLVLWTLEIVFIVYRLRPS